MVKIENFETAGLPPVGPAKLRIDSLVEREAKTREGETYTRLEGEFTILDTATGVVDPNEKIRSRFSLRRRALFRFSNLYKAVHGVVPQGDVDIQDLADTLLGREVWGIIVRSKPNAQGAVFAELGTKFGAKYEDVAGAAA